MDPVNTAEMLSNLPLSLVFDLEGDFQYNGSLSDVGISDVLSDHYTQCVSMNDPENIADLL